MDEPTGRNLFSFYLKFKIWIWLNDPLFACSNPTQHMFYKIISYVLILKGIKLHSLLIQASFKIILHSRSLKKKLLVFTLKFGALIGIWEVFLLFSNLWTYFLGIGLGELVSLECNNNPRKVFLNTISHIDIKKGRWDRDTLGENRT